MEQIEITNDAPPMIGSKTINIEGADYKYAIKKDEKENEIIIQLSEAKPDKYITRHFFPAGCRDRSLHVRLADCKSSRREDEDCDRNKANCEKFLSFHL